MYVCMCVCMCGCVCGVYSHVDTCTCTCMCACTCTCIYMYIIILLHMYIVHVHYVLWVRCMYMYICTCILICWMVMRLLQQLLRRVSACTRSQKRSHALVVQRLPTKCARTRSPRAGDCRNESVRSRTSCRVASQERKAERLNEEWLPGLRLRCGVRGLTKMSCLNAAKMAQKRPFDGLQPRHRENKDRVVTFHNQTCQGRNRPGLVHLCLWTSYERLRSHSCRRRRNAIATGSIRRS